MGDQNLEAKLNKLAKDPKVMQSLIDMENADQIADPMSFHHNRRIRKLLTDARKAAWAKIDDLPEVVAAREADQELRRAKVLQRKGKTGEADEARQSALTLRNK